MSVIKSVRAVLLASALVTVATSAGAQAQPVADTKLAYAIPGGTLTTVLNRFAETSGIQISYEATLAENYPEALKHEQEVATYLQNSLFQLIDSANTKAIMRYSEIRQERLQQLMTSEKATEYKL